VIFEEFKGTGNMEVILDRRIAERRTFPAIDVQRSGTRKEEILLSKEELNKVYLLRNFLADMPPVEAIEFLLERLKRTKTNNDSSRPWRRGDGRRDAGRLLGVDWASAASASPSPMRPHARSTPHHLTRRSGKRFPMREFLTLLEQHAVTGVVVGLPLDQEGAEAEAPRPRGRWPPTSRSTRTAVELWDERLTTARALRAVRAMGGSTRGRKDDVDALAATLLLQHYLDAKRGSAT